MLPYGLMLRLGGVLVALAVLWGGCSYVRALRAEAAQATELRDSLAAERANGELALKMSLRAAARDADRVRADRAAEEKIRRETKPLPEACRAECLSWYGPVLRNRGLLRKEQSRGS